MNSKETLFAGLAGLRGSVSLILAQAVVTEDDGAGDETSQVRSFVLCSVSAGAVEHGWGSALTVVMITWVQPSAHEPGFPVHVCENFFQICCSCTP